MIADHRRLTKALVFAYEEIVTRFGEACNDARFTADSGILAVEPGSLALAYHSSVFL
jgi:hypothetical protein